MGLLSKAEKVLEKQYLEYLEQQDLEQLKNQLMRLIYNDAEPKTHFTGLNIRFRKVE